MECLEEGQAPSKGLINAAVTIATVLIVIMVLL